MHLIRIYQPSYTLLSQIPGYDDEDAKPPHWNVISNRDVALWYSSLFTFVESYLDDNNEMIVLMPCRLSYKLLRLVIKCGFEVKAQWICTQPKPLPHPMFLDMLINHCCIIISRNDMCLYSKCVFIVDSNYLCTSFCRHITIL